MRWLRSILVGAAVFLAGAGHAQMLPFPGSNVVTSGSVTCTYQTTAADASALTTYTFAGQAIGSASADRVVVVAAWGRTSAGSPVINSVTVGGNAATQVVQAGTVTETRNSLWVIAVPTGTTASVVVTWSSGVVRTAIGIWSMVGTGGSTTVAHFTSTSSASTQPSVTMDVPANGCAIAAASEVSSGSLTSTWAGLAEDYDTNVTTNSFSGSHTNFVAAQTGLTISDTFSGSPTQPVLVAASWGP